MASTGSRIPMSRRLMRWLLRSPFSDLVDRSVMLISVRGRKTGMVYTFPAQYAEDGEKLWVFPGDHEHKTWWRNLAEESPVGVRLRGRDIEATARVLSSGTSRELTEQGIRSYLHRFPQVARRWGVVSADGKIDEARLREFATGSVVVRITLPKSSSLPPAEERGEDNDEATSMGLISRHPLASFYALTFLLSWGYWVPDALLGGRWSHAPGLMGPMVAALVITGVTAGTAGLRDLITRMFRWRVAVKWYLWVLAPLLLALITAGFLALGGGEFPPFDEWTEINGFAAITGWAGLGLALIVNCFGEETGWRGFALPAFRRRHHELTASLLVAAPWALWHLPTFFIDSGYRDFPIVFLPGWLLGFFALAVVMTWIYEGADSSILIIALLHLSLNIGSTSLASKGLVSAVVTTSVIIWSIAIAAHWRRRDRSLDRQAGTIPDLAPESVHTSHTQEKNPHVQDLARIVGRGPTCLTPLCHLGSAQRRLPGLPR